MAAPSGVVQMPSSRARSRWASTISSSPTACGWPPVSRMSRSICRPANGPGTRRPCDVGERILPRSTWSSAFSSQARDERRAALGLDRDEARLAGLDPAHRGQLLVGLPDADEPGAAPGGIDEHIGRVPAELLGQLEADGLLALEPVGLLERGQVEPADLGRDHRDDPPRGGDGAIHREHVGAGQRGLGDGRLGRVARHHHRHRDARAGAVHRGGAARVARRRDHKPAHAERARPVIAMPSPRALKQPVGVLALVLGPEVPQAQVRGEPGQREQRRTPLARGSPAPRRRRAAAARGSGTSRAAAAGGRPW